MEKAGWPSRNLDINTGTYRQETEKCLYRAAHKMPIDDEDGGVIRLL
jgi:hypothetical protein